MDAVLSDLAPVHLGLLRLLIVGGTRQAHARALHISPRTVDLRIADLKRHLATADRLCLGARAVSQGWIDPQFPLLHAQARRTGTGWVMPTTRQLDIIRQRGSGAGVEEVAAALGVSRGTVRRELPCLAAVNGARNAVHAGALFQALGWVSAPGDPTTQEPPASSPSVVVDSWRWAGLPTLPGVQSGPQPADGPVLVRELTTSRTCATASSSGTPLRCDPSR